jgi:hypothetical protein
MFRGEIKAVGDLASGSGIAYIRRVTFVTSLKENGKWQGLVKQPPDSACRTRMVLKSI